MTAMKNNNENNVMASGERRKTAVSPKSDAFLPLLLATVSASLALIMLIIDKFIYSFGGDLLSPMLGQLIVLLIPSYLCIQISSYKKSASAQLKWLGFRKMGAEYIFFLIFTALFMMATSFVLNTLFYGVYRASEGFTVLGIFTAGVNEYTVSYPYLILVYALTPAIIEELMFRGVIYAHLSQISRQCAIIGSSLISAIFSFTLGGFPSAVFCALTYCFIRYITGSLISCMAVHFAFNLYGLFLQTNLSKYLISSQNNILLLTATIVVFLLFAALFFSECAHIFKIKNDRIVAGEAKSDLSPFDLEALKSDALSILHHRPSLICSILCLAIFIAMIIIGAFF